MDVIVDVSWQVVVDDVSDVGDIETTGSDSSGDQEGAAAAAEELEGTLTLALGTVTVNGGGREVLSDEEVTESIGHTLSLDEDQGQTGGTVCVEDIKENGSLVNVLDILDLLSNVLRGGTDTTDRQEDVVLQEVAGENLDVTGESGREHEGLAVVDLGHILTLDDTTDLRLETHVQHAVSLIKNQVLDVSKRDTATLDDVDETTGGSDEKIAAALDLTELGADISTTVDNARANPRAVSELASLVEDLRDKLTSGSKNQRGRVSLALAAIETRAAAGSVSRRSGGAVLESLREDGEQETTSLSGTSLSTSHKITTTHDDGDRVFLNGGWGGIASELDVGEQVVIQGRVGEGVDSLGDVIARGLDWDVIVVGEVDTGVLLVRVVGNTEELTLKTGVRGTGDVLAIAPLTVARAARSRSTSTSTSTAVRGATVARIAVGSGIKATTATTTPAAASAAVRRLTGWTVRSMLEYVAGLLEE